MVEEFDDVGMIQAGHGLSFAIEAFTVLRIQCVLFVENLDGDLAVGFGIIGQINFPAGSSAEPALDEVTTDFRILTHDALTQIMGSFRE